MRSTLLFALLCGTAAATASVSEQIMRHRIEKTLGGMGTQEQTSGYIEDAINWGASTVAHFADGETGRLANIVVNYNDVEWPLPDIAQHDVDGHPGSSGYPLVLDGVYPQFIPRIQYTGHVADVLWRFHRNGEEEESKDYEVVPCTMQLPATRINGESQYEANTDSSKKCVRVYFNKHTMAGFARENHAQERTESGFTNLLFTKNDASVVRPNRRFVMGIEKARTMAHTGTYETDFEEFAQRAKQQMSGLLEVDVNATRAKSRQRMTEKLNAISESEWGTISDLWDFVTNHWVLKALATPRNRENLMAGVASQSRFPSQIIEAGQDNTVLAEMRDYGWENPNIPSDWRTKRDDLAGIAQDMLDILDADADHQTTSQKSESICFHMERTRHNEAEGAAGDEDHFYVNDQRCAGDVPCGYWELPLNADNETPQITMYRATLAFLPHRKFELHHGLTHFKIMDGGDLLMSYKASQHFDFFERWDGKNAGDHPDYDGHLWVGNSGSGEASAMDDRSTTGYVSNSDWTDSSALNDRIRRLLRAAYVAQYQKETDDGFFNSALFDRFPSAECDAEAVASLEDEFTSLKAKGTAYKPNIGDFDGLDGFMSELLDMLSVISGGIDCAANYLKSDLGPDMHWFDTFELTGWGHYLAEMPDDITLEDIARNDWWNCGVKNLEHNTELNVLTHCPNMFQDATQGVSHSHNPHTHNPHQHNPHGHRPGW